MNPRLHSSALSRSWFEPRPRGERHDGNTVRATRRVRSGRAHGADRGGPVHAHTVPIRFARFRRIRLPRSPHLKPFTFFTSTLRAVPTVAERRYLHMGYFATLTDAQKWAQLMRGAYPNATATLAPAALLRQPSSGIPTLRSADEPKRVPATETQKWAPAENISLTDTQVLTILETRRVTPMQNNSAERNGAQISLLRPEDTGTRRILREAVVQGAPVFFAVQLHRSVQPIDLTSVPALSIFQAFTLYTTGGHRDGRSWHCLRLGFFSDAIAAKQVAYYVRPSFSSAAVVPVTEQECTRANETLIHLPALADPGAATYRPGARC